VKIVTVQMILNMRYVQIVQRGNMSNQYIIETTEIVLYDADFAEEQKLSMRIAQLSEEIIEPNHNIRDNRWRLECGECGVMLGYVYRPTEPESAFTATMHKSIFETPQILLCTGCSDKYGDDWANEPYYGECE